jgi:hypothetical protein
LTASSTKIFPAALLSFFLWWPLAAPAAEAGAEVNGLVSPGRDGADQALSEAEERLRRSYPQVDIAFQDEADGRYLVIDGLKIMFRPAAGCPKVDPEGAEDPPLCAVFQFEYPGGEGGRCPAEGFDPGRIRNEAFMRRLYGGTAEETGNNCITMDFFGAKVLFNQRQGAAEALQRVIARLELIIQQEPGAKEYIRPTAGTLNWRKIQGTDRLSAHSFGVAIDLSALKAPYWKWKTGIPEGARRGYPQAIVEAFEAEGFIWGGKWHSYDFMHFEYRPELLP